MKHLKLTVFILLCLFITPIFSATSEVIKFPVKKETSECLLPYNYRIIDSNIHAGGHPLNPKNWFRNSDEEVLSILHYLKSKGVNTIIDLENTWRIQKRYRKLLKEAGLKRIHIPMHIAKVPNKEEWAQIKEAMNDPVYIHCKWGADRTGAIIGRYLVEEKGYRTKDAWKAVISKGSHSGPIGGLKTSKYYAKLAYFFWPDAREDAEFRGKW